jgi:hypothetical protein
MNYVILREMRTTFKGVLGWKNPPEYWNINVPAAMQVWYSEVMYRK